jgi:drug/metabolite transporter (DMT)-like permease
MTVKIMTSVKVNLALAITLFFWASAFVGIRIGLISYTPGSLALLRFLVASVCMAIIYLFTSHKRYMPIVIRLQLMVIGVIGIGVYNFCLNTGELLVSAGIASFVIGLMPIITLILSVLFFGERPHRWVWMGVLVSLIGLLLIVLGDSKPASIGSGVLIILISAGAGGIYSISQKRYLVNFHPVAITAWVIWGGTLALSWFANDLMSELPKAFWSATIAAIYMGIFPAALAYVAWCYVLDHIPVSKACMYLYFLPVLSTLLGFFLLNEQPSKLSFTGGIFALIGALVATRTPYPRFKKID